MAPLARPRQGDSLIQGRLYKHECEQSIPEKKALRHIGYAWMAGIDHQGKPIPAWPNIGYAIRLGSTMGWLMTKVMIPIGYGYGYINFGIP